jgi:AhpD family alkylhydroperoxidase
MAAHVRLIGDPAATAEIADHLGPAIRTVLEQSALPASVQNLVLLRASQLNGDTRAAGMWSRHAARAGESAARIAQVAAWRDAAVFTPAERAALELAEQGARIAAGAAASDGTWTDAAEHYGHAELADLVMLIALVNATGGMGAIIGRRDPERRPEQRPERRPARRVS